MKNSNKKPLDCWVQQDKEKTLPTAKNVYSDLYM